MKNQFFTKALALSILICSAYLFSNAQAPNTQWQKCIGGSGDEFAQNIIKLSDGNFLTCGTTNSHNGNFNATHGSYDAFLVKTNGEGDILWKKTYGGSDFDAFYNMVETTNGDIYAIGATSSNDGQVSGLHGSVGTEDIWLAKLNSNGNLLSQHCYGGSGDDYSIKLIQTHQGNLAFVGITSSNDGDVPNNHGDYDGWVVKLNTSGAIDFSVTIGDTAYDDLTGMAQVSGGFLVTGITSTLTGDIAPKAYDAVAAKIDNSGGIVYYRKYGGSKSDDCNAMIISSDGNAVLTGHTGSTDGDVIGNTAFNVWTFKIDVANNGNILWQSFFGNPTDTAAGFNLIETHDGGFAIVGAIGPNEGAPLRTWDAYAGKIDATGNLLWKKRFGGNKFDGINSVVEENNHSLLMAGSSKSNNGDVHGNHGGAQDVWLVNLDGCEQRNSNPQPPAPETVVSCKCNVLGYGCFPTSWGCKMACASYCHNHRMADTGSISDDESSAINIYPNPVSEFSTIAFSLNQSEKVSIRIYDMTGRLIKTICNEVLPSGLNELKWNATDEKQNEVNAGLYLLMFDTEYYSETKKLSVIK